jgi:hypothetical protein
MWLAEETPIRKQDLTLDKPWVNAAGVLGFAPDPNKMPFLDQMGAFITHPISRRPRQPAKDRCCLPYQGGFLLHTGLPNPGISRAIQRNRHRWAGASLPVIAHLLVETPETLAEMIQKLEGLENVVAVELGLPPDCTPEGLAAFVEAAVGELPTILSLNPDQIPVLLPALNALHPAAVHLTQPRGTLPGLDSALVTGRLYGPAVFPQVLHAARALVAGDLQVIADGGGHTPWQAEALLGVGVAAVGLAEALWGINTNQIT